MNKNDISAKEGVNAITGTDWERLAAMTDEDIDLSDIPELTEEQLQNMRPTAELIPALANRGKTRITIRLDDQVVAFFKQQAADNDASYQTLINAALHYFMIQQQQKDDLRVMIRQIVREELANAGD
ncbi:MAG: BrnA antitoxin family protein [Ardenticatenaceae bacterium]|nr:BrnA antitoxin family protein [Ardenticatenaceae bacterium]